MNKLIVSIMLILSMLFLSSCFIGGSRTDMLNKSNDEENARARMESIYEALKNEDKETLKAMFSEQALSDADDFDGNLDKLFDFFDGEFDSWEKITGLNVEESNDHGHVTKRVQTSFYLYTDKQKYCIELEDFPVDTDHPDNVDLYLLLVVKAEDEEKVWDGEQKIMFDDRVRILRAGIYLPFE